MPYLILIIMVIYLLSLLPDRKIVLSSGKNINLSISSMVLVVFLCLNFQVKCNDDNESLIVV